MNIRPIKTTDDYDAAIDRIGELMNAEADTEAGAELDVLAILVDAYEAKNFPIDSPDPVEAIKFRMDQMGLGQKDLAVVLGGRNRASEVLRRKRKLTIKQIRILHDELRIPFENLLGTA